MGEASIRRDTGLIRDGRLDALKGKGRITSRGVHGDWTIAQPKQSVRSDFAMCVKGAGKESRLYMTLHEVDRWFRLLQAIDLPEEAGTLELAVTASADGTDGLRSICVMEICERGGYSIHQKIASEVMLPQMPGTVKWSAPLKPTRAGMRYALVLEFDRPCTIELWCVSLRIAEFVQDSDDEAGRCEDGFTDAAYRHAIKQADRDLVRGWAVVVDRPHAVVDVSLYLDNVFYGSARSDLPRPDLSKLGLSCGQGGFRFELPKGLVGKSGARVRIEMPDGSDECARIEPIRDLASPIPAWTPGREPRTVAIIIPVYNALKDLEVCIDRGV